MKPHAGPANAPTAAHLAHPVLGDGAELLLSLVFDVDCDKRCDTCRERKPLTDFPTHRGSHDWHRTTCAECLLTGRYTLYIEPPEYRARRKVRQARLEWQASHRVALERYAEHEADRAQATKAMRAALNGKRIAPAERCQVHGCSSAQFIEAHHWSYEPEHWLDVLWCCAVHHRQGHGRGFIIPAAGLAAHYGLIPGLDQAKALQIIGQCRAGVIGICATCAQAKPARDFLPSRRTASGLTDRCKACVFAAAPSAREPRIARAAR